MKKPLVAPNIKVTRFKVNEVISTSMPGVDWEIDLDLEEKNGVLLD